MGSTVTLPKFHFISHEDQGGSHLFYIKKALKAGARWIQLRFKEGNDGDKLEVAQDARAFCSVHGAMLTINNDVELVKMVGADGVHLGKNDMAPQEARKLLSSDILIGGTANSLEDIARVAGQGVDYIGLGPFRQTDTKKKLDPVLGLEGYRERIEWMRSQGIDLPVYAIGGIEIPDVDAILATGVYGIAGFGLVGKSTDPSSVVQTIENLKYS